DAIGHDLAALRGRAGADGPAGVDRPRRVDPERRHAAGAVRGGRLGRVGPPWDAGGQVAVQRVGGDGVEGHAQSYGCAKLARGARGGGWRVEGEGTGRIVSDRTAVVPPPEPVASPLLPHTALSPACHTSGPDSVARGRRPARRLSRPRP